MDEGLSQPHAAAVRAPRGTAVRYRPGDDPGAWGLWHEWLDLPGGRIGIALGRSAEPRRAERLRSEIRSALADSADPRTVLDHAGRGRDDGSTALCGLIDRTTSLVAYASLGATEPALGSPETGWLTLGAAPDGVARVALPPGATLVLGSNPILGGAMSSDIGTLLGDSVTSHPERTADQLIATMPPTPALVAVVYRHPPAPMDVTVPADPSSLVTVRSRLRDWLALAGVDPEPSADSLLAVGEAASNAAEHAVEGLTRGVVMRVRASVHDNRLRFTVSDDGMWKTPAAGPTPRGHGIRLINALVDTVDLRTTKNGTTVEMVKELPP